MKSVNNISNKSTEKTRSTLSEGTRLEWIDGLRALAMIFVVMVHASNGLNGWWIYNVFVGPIMMPLFFTISGYLFNDRSGNQKIFFINITRRIIIPWLVFAFVLMLPFTGLKDFFLDLYDVISGKELWWFMPAFIISEIIFFYICKFFKKLPGICVVVGVSVLLGAIMAYFDIGNFAMFNRAMIAQIFLLLGKLIRVYKDKILNLKYYYVVLGILLYGLLGAVSMYVFPNQYMDVHLNMYYNIPICFSMIFIGCTTLFIIASKLKKVPKFIRFLGENTLICYIFHLQTFGVLFAVSPIIGIEQYNWTGAIIRTVFAITLCCILALILNKFLPEVVGRRRKLKNT